MSTTRKTQKVQIIDDPNDAAQALLRGVEVGVDPAGKMRAKIDRELTPDELEALLDSLPRVERSIRRKLARLRGEGGRYGLH